MRKGSKEDAFERCGERPVKVKIEIAIAGTNKDWQFRARQPETSDFGEANLDRACAIEREAATGREELVAMDKSRARRRDPSSPT